MASGEDKTPATRDFAPIFKDFNYEDPDAQPTVIESLCMNCEKDGETRMIFTKIPYFKDVVIMSFHCDHCGYCNNEIQDAGKVENKGVTIELKMTQQSDLNRQVIKSDYTCIRIPHVEFEIPMQSQKGGITTVEGIIDRAIEGLEQNQTKRWIEYPECAKQISEFIVKLKDLKRINEPYLISFQDISGNTCVLNPKGPQHDDQCEVTYFERTKEQNRMLGIYSENESNILQPIDPDQFTYEDINQEVLSFATNCPECNNPCDTNMKLTKIPHFKEVVIMATVCEFCGYRTNEVKSGSGIEPQGVRIELKINGKEDFSRDVLKSETCTMKIPELDVELGPTTLGGRFTTVEGILSAIKNQLSSSTAFTGDSVAPNIRKQMDNFMSELDQVLQGDKKVTLILDDPAGNSYVQCISDTEDKGFRIFKYHRSSKQEEELGLLDMKVENY